MKRLLVMRHAKSDWNAGVSSDHARPLNPRGRRAAPAMGRLLTAIGETPQYVITSSATRARTTAELARKGGGWDADLDVRDALYGTSPDGILAEIATVPEEFDSLMVVGHQPTLGGLVAVLTGGSVAVKTATVAIIDLYLGASWASAEPPHGELIAVLQPRHVAGMFGKDSS